MHAQTTEQHPRVFAETKDRAEILAKIETEDWAKVSWNNLLENIGSYVNRHVEDPEWIVSRLAMYWKDGAHFTQCYIKGQNWDYGEGNAPVPTVRLPGMRTWNDYVNVPLEDRIPYNESGDLLGISRSSADKTPVLIPYKKTGHMVRANNMEILTLAEKSAFAFYITQDEKYAKFSSDILWTWLLGTYYMEPPLDPKQSTNGPGGYKPGGIMGYYDYEVIHDDRQIPTSIAYDFLYDYIHEHPHEHLKKMNKTPAEVAGVVFKRFIDIGLIRGGKRGNWNVNRYKNILSSMLVLESNDFYKDGKGRDYYMPFYTEKSTDYCTALPGIMDYYNKTTGLWPESPGYASGMIPLVLKMGVKLYKAGINTLAGNPIISKAALANLGWLDARGNLVVFGDMRGGPANMSSFESLLTYSTWEGDTETAKKMATVIRKNIASGQYDRNTSDWQGIIFNQPLPESGSDLPFHKAAYSPFHKHIIMRNGNNENNGLMFTLYGGKHKSHLAKNGLAMQFYGKGWALAPDASAYESYWSPDAGYHREITGSNTIVPGYREGDITINAMDPMVDTTTGFYNTSETSENISFADVSADEKRRLVAMVRTSETSGYYVDIFRSDQSDNDYIHHNLGHSMLLKNTSNTSLNLKAVNDLGVKYDKNYAFFKNQRKINYSNDFNATWTITAESPAPALNVNMWMMGQDNRTLYHVDAPPTTLRSDITPGQVNKSPEITPTLIVRQNNINGKKHPFLAVFESYEIGKKSIQEISRVHTSDNFVSIKVNSKNSTQYICNAIDNKVHKPMKHFKFQGIFGTTSEENNNFQYLYLGKGKLLQKGPFKIEAVNESVTAELKYEAGTYYYSSDKPILIQLEKGKSKEYPAGYHIKIK
ncbi:heparinase II/III family protein [Flavivirga jejuensis]